MNKILKIVSLYFSRNPNTYMVSSSSKLNLIHGMMAGGILTYQGSIPNVMELLSVGYVWHFKPEYDFRNYYISLEHINEANP